MNQQAPFLIITKADHHRAVLNPEASKLLSPLTTAPSIITDHHHDPSVPIITKPCPLIPQPSCVQIRRAFLELSVSS